MRLATGATRSTTATRAVQALNTGGTLHDLITVTTADGTTQPDRHHHQRRQRRGGDHRRVIRRGDRGERRANGTPGVSTATGTPDGDRCRQLGDLRPAEQCVTSYGHFSIDASGNWSYTLDDSNAAVQALNAGGTLHDLITVTTADGTTPARSTSRSTAPTTRR